MRAPRALLVFAGVTIVARASAQDTFTLPYEKEPEAAVQRVQAAPPAEPAPIVHARPASWLLTGGLGGSFYSIQQDTGGVSESGRSGSGSIGVTRYLPAVVDDDQPRTLQPFLQRVSSFGLSFSGGGFVTDADGRPRNRTAADFGVSGNTELYLTRFFLVQGSFGYSYTVLHDVGIADTTHGFDGILGVGVRLGDTRIVASYALVGSDTNGTFAQQYWGPLSLAAFIVIASRVSLAPSAFAQQDGGGGALTIVYYATRSFDVFLGGSGQTGGHALDGVVYDSFGGSVGFTAWAAPTVRIGASYGVGDTHTPHQTVRELTYGADQITNSASVNVGVRLP